MGAPDVVGSGGSKEIAAGSGTEGSHGLGPGRAFHDDAVDVADRLALVRETCLDKAAEKREERLDASQRLRPQADLRWTWQGNTRFFEEQVDSEGCALRPRQGPETEGLLLFWGIEEGK